MSKLSFSGRPYVAFDPAIKEHRQWFAEFQQLGTWSRCPVRFIVSDDTSDLVTFCQRKLITYYVNKEFGDLKGFKSDARVVESLRNFGKISH